MKVTRLFFSAEFKSPCMYGIAEHLSLSVLAFVTQYFSLALVSMLYWCVTGFRGNMLEVCLFVTHDLANFRHKEDLLSKRVGSPDISRALLYVWYSSCKMIFRAFF